MSLENYTKLTAQRKPRQAGAGKHLLSGAGIDVNKLLATPVPEHWWQKIVGTFKDDPAHEEAMRLGREWREAYRLDDIPDSPEGT